MVTKEQLEQAFIERHGKENFEKLKNAKVAVAGLGGLGSNISISLTRAGIGSLHIVDFDKVDISNINRQQYYLEDIGRDKTQALSEKLLKINPYLNLTTDTVKINGDNVPSLFEKEDYICEAFDVPECKAMLLDAVCEKMPEKYLVCGTGMAGFDSANKIKTKKLTSKIFICGDGVSDVHEKGSLFAPRVAVCANHQALAVIRLILGCKDV